MWIAVGISGICVFAGVLSWVLAIKYLIQLILDRGNASFDDEGIGAIMFIIIGVIAMLIGGAGFAGLAECMLE